MPDPTDPDPTDPDPMFSERLWVPAWLWLVAAMWPLTLGVAYGYAVSPTVGLAVGGVLSLLVVAGLINVSTRIALSASGLTVGRAFLAAEYVGRLSALDATQTRQVLGPAADARAFTVVRGWVPESVQLAVEDARDPTPYWVLSTRRPGELAAAMNSLGSTKA